MAIFFLELEQFPLKSEKEEDRNHDLRRREMICWRCTRTFKKFVMLKRHLKEEFTAWNGELIIANNSSKVKGMMRKRSFDDRSNSVKHALANIVQS